MLSKPCAASLWWAPSCPQTIRCQRLAANASALAGWLEALRPATATSSTHRCCAVLDGPPVPGEQHSMAAVLLAAAVPPSGLGASGTSCAGRVVRALTLCSSTAVCPPGKHLLYLWADASDGDSSSGGQHAGADGVLLPALAALADTGTLQAQVSARGSPADAASAAAQQAEHAEPDGSRAGHEKPAVLWAAFYTQDSPQLVPPEQLVGSSGSRWPTNVALCPGPDSSVTLASAVEAAKRCYWQLFPPGDCGTAAAGGAAAFPLDPQQPGQGEAGSEDAGAADGTGGAARAASTEDAGSDDEALVALQAALQAARLDTSRAGAEGQQQAKETE